MSARRGTTNAGESDRLAETVYRLLLRAYPAAFRAGYGREMVQLFRDQRRDRGSDTDAAFWAAVLWDVARSAPALRLDALRTRWRAIRRRARRAGPWGDGPHLHIEGNAMNGKRIVAVLALVSGAFEVANALADVWASTQLPRGGGWVLAVSLSVVMGILLAVAGVALLRRGAGATRVVRAVAVACLALVVGLQLVFPFMSIFSRLLGVVVPIALLLVTRRSGGTSGRDPSVAAVV